MQVFETNRLGVSFPYFIASGFVFVSLSLRRGMQSPLILSLWVFIIQKYLSQFGKEAKTDAKMRKRRRTRTYIFMASFALMRDTKTERRTDTDSARIDCNLINIDALLNG